MRAKPIFIFAVFFTFIGLSSNVRAQWALTDSTYGTYISYLSAIGHNLFEESAGGDFLSTDEGTTWNLLDSEYGYLRHISNFFIDDSILFGTDGTLDGIGVYISTDSGKTWNARSNGLPFNFGFFGISKIGNKIFASNYDSVFISSDLGMNWIFDSATTPFLIWTSIGSQYFSSVGGGVFRSTDSGKTWMERDSGLSNPFLHSLTSMGNNLIAGVDDGIYISTDYGSSWSQTNLGPQGIAEASPTCFVTFGSILFAGMYRGGVVGVSGIYISSDSGQTWVPFNDGFPNSNVSVYSMVVNDSFIFAGTDLAGVWRRPLSDFRISSVAIQPLANSVLAAYPNPFTHSTTLEFTAPESGYAMVTIVNALGVEVAWVFAGELSAGEHSFQWNADDLPQGAYECIVRLNGKVSETGIVVE